MPLFSGLHPFLTHPHLRLIALVGVIVPRRLRAEWRQEWEAELRYRESLLAEWDRLDRRRKLELLWRSTSAFWDALWLQPHRLEDELFQDLRYGVRMLLKSPGFTAVVVLTLALGIGANTAIFNLTNAALLRPLPVKDPQQLTLFTIVDPQGSANSFNYPLIEQFVQNNHSLTGIAAATGAERTRMSEPGAGGQVEMVQATRVSGNFFSVLGVGAVAGRTLTEDDDKASEPQPVAVISYHFWKRRFGLDPSVVGKKIILDDFPFTIIGVAPPGFFGFEVGDRPDVWWPLRMIPVAAPNNQILTESGSWWLRVMARLKPGVSIEQARAEMDLIFKNQINQIAPERAAAFTPAQRRNHFERSIRLDSGRTGFTYLRRTITQPLLILMTVVGLVLLIACANVANLLLARAAGRRKEIAVRLALGAGRWRLIRQLLTESFVLTALSGALGLLFAYSASGLLLSYLPQQRTFTFDLTPDARVLGFTFIVSMLTGILFGLAPALRATRLDLTSSLKDTAGAGGGRVRLELHKALIVAQVALSLFLLVGAGLFVRSLQNLRDLDAGFNRENIALFRLDLGGDYTLPRRLNLYKQLLERLERLPGAQAASLSNINLLSGNNSTAGIVVEGYAARSDEDLNCHQLLVGPKFFATMGIPVLLGRDFGSQELQPPDGFNGTPPAAGQPSQSSLAFSGPIPAIINQTMARYFFGTENPLGRRFHYRGGSRRNVSIEVIGVVKDSKYRTLREETPRTFYLPFFQWTREGGVGAVQLRTFGDPTGVTAAIQRTVRELDPQIQVLNLQTMNDVVNESLTQERFVAQLAGFFSLFALLLACIGLYGVMSYAVARRTSEIGVRMALGAQRGDIIRLVMREVMMLVTAGMILGLGAALAATRLVTSLLFGLQPGDPTTIALAALLMLAVAALAGYLPARRASRVDPMVAMRCE